MSNPIGAGHHLSSLRGGNEAGRQRGTEMREEWERQAASESCFRGFSCTPTFPGLGWPTPPAITRAISLPVFLPFA